ncbi:MAG: hypothetical protein R3Y57_05680, partial [Erysipelotrichaceae bacterium]
MNERIFVEKKSGFNTEAIDLMYSLKQQLKCSIEDLRIVLVYDVFNIEKEVLEKAKQTVFSEIMVDQLIEDLDLTNKQYIAMETLPGQYDQR